MQLQQLLNKDLDNMKYADLNERKIRLRVQISNGIKDGTKESFDLVNYPEFSNV